VTAELVDVFWPYEVDDTAWWDLEVEVPAVVPVQVPLGRLPIGPLMAWLEPRPHLWFRFSLAQRGSLQRSYLRAKATGWITWKAADTLAIRILETHPCLIWGEAWWECDEPMPVGPSR
jgi:hypothetical protein